MRIDPVKLEQAKELILENPKEFKKAVLLYYLNKEVTKNEYKRS